MIQLIDTNKSFQLGGQTVQALDDVNLTINDGDYLSIMGPSGSGKSTLLNIMGLLDRPDSGQYFIDNIDTVLLSEEKRARIRREQIGFVFQAYHLVSRLTARENIELPLVLGSVTPNKRRRLVDQALESLGITDRADHLPNQLSGGQRQRVAIGRAIVMKPTLLLADEPTGNLDSHSGAEVINMLEELNQQGITLIVVTHDVSLGRRARRRIKMLDGAIEREEN